MAYILECSICKCISFVEMLSENICPVCDNEVKPKEYGKEKRKKEELDS